MRTRPDYVAVAALMLMTVVVAPVGAADASSGESPVAEILVSRQVSEAYGVRVGDVVLLAADPEGGETRRFEIAGIYEPTPDPMRINAERHEVRLHLPDLLRLTADPADPIDRETAHGINVTLSDPADASAFARDLAGRVPGLYATPTTMEDESNPFLALEQFHVAIAVITVLGSSMFLLALMVMRADERREVAGILRLVGLSKRRILVGVLVEGLLIAVAGAVFGVLFARATEGIVNSFFQHHYDTALVFIRVTAPIALRCIAVAVPLGVLAGLAASWTLLRRDIVALLRR